MSADYASADAEFSADGLHRLSLRRWWDYDRRPAVFIGLNPSTAGADEDNPTVRRCVRFARDWGFGGLVIVNLFTLIATDPKVLAKHERRSLPTANRRRMDAAVANAGIVIGAWGAGCPVALPHWMLRERGIPHDYAVLGLTKSGAPRHPLYLPASTVPLSRTTLQPVSIPGPSGVGSR